MSRWICIFIAAIYLNLRLLQCLVAEIFEELPTSSIEFIEALLIEWHHQ